MSVYITDKDGKLVKVSGNILPLSAQSVALNTTRTGQNDTVIEYYMSSDGSSWYRKWASGWKECGMSFSKSNTDSGGITKILPLSFSNTNYIVVASANAGTYAGVRAGAVETDEIVIGFGDYTNITVSCTATVYCCGY